MSNVRRHKLTMPKLLSGRCVAVRPNSLLPALLQGSDEIVYGNIVAFRLEVPNPKALRRILRVLYCEDVKGKRPEETFTDSPFVVQQVESGASDWSATEVEEFVAWLDSNEKLNQWLEVEYTAVHEAIKAHPIWRSSFILDE